MTLLTKCSLIFLVIRATEIKVNGFVCKDDADVTAADFTFNGLAKPALINNSFGSVVTTANVMQVLFI